MEAVGVVPQVEPPKGAARREMIAGALREAGLEPAMMENYPHELSGRPRHLRALPPASTCRLRLRSRLASHRPH